MAIGRLLPLPSVYVSLVPPVAGVSMNLSTFSTSSTSGGPWLSLDVLEPWPRLL